MTMNYATNDQRTSATTGSSSTREVEAADGLHPASTDREGTSVSDVAPSKDGPRSRRVIFTFDEKSYATLKQLETEYGSMAEAVRASLRINATLTKQRHEGFTEVVLRNPSNPSIERVID